MNRALMDHPIAYFRHKITGDILSFSDRPGARAVVFARRDPADWEELPFGMMPGAIEMFEMMAGQA